MGCSSPSVTYRVTAPDQQKDDFPSAPVASLSKMFHGKSAFVFEVLNSLTTIIFTTELAHSNTMFHGAPSADAVQIYRNLP
jgi:hypothetical protein